jgi:hypothetical protein
MRKKGAEVGGRKIRRTMKSETLIEAVTIPVPVLFCRENVGSGAFGDDMYHNACHCLKRYFLLYNLHLCEPTVHITVAKKVSLH